MNVYTKSSSLSTPRRFEDSKRWGASWAAAHPKNGKAASPSTATPRRVSGEYLAKNRLDARGRAALAADLIEDRIALGRLTAKQIILICRANGPYVAEARKSPAVPVRETTLAETLAAATPQDLARELGTHKLWEILEHATS